MYEQKITQREAVYLTVVQVLGNRFEEGKTPVLQIMKNIECDYIKETLFVMFKSGAVTCHNQMLLDDDDDLKSYIKGLLNNWLRKDTRLNGGRSYTPSRGRPLSKAQGDIVYSPTLSIANEFPLIDKDPFMGRLGEEPRLKSEICDCGAKHTSNSNYHTDWCSTQH